MESLGWPLRLREVRSFEKLTVGGISLLDVDVAHVLDRVLPERFGGRATDWQIVEHPEPDGRAGIRLRAHPDLGPLDEAEVVAAFLDALGTGDGGRLMARALDRGGVVRVERAPAARTVSGKILHVHAEAAPVPEAGPPDQTAPNRRSSSARR